MSKEQAPHEAILEAQQLRLPEPEISTEEPWRDDALERSKVAEALTNLIRGQRQPLVISLHGKWGTGKTFLLRRWQKDFKEQKFRVIYFNAWEDDFCDDPLAAIIGQLSDSLAPSKEGKFNDAVEKIKKAAIPLFFKNISSVLANATGVTIVNDVLETLRSKILEEYYSQRKSKDELKKQLTVIADQVFKETKQPLVFIVDELDRCRPTFAVELLERVKHIFDIPNMVFVFGINRDELCSSLELVYGKIEANVYLQRFFDIEFVLPGVDATNFWWHLIKKYGLNETVSKMGKVFGNNEYVRDFGDLVNIFARFCGNLALSLRDIERCAQSIVFVMKNIGNKYFLAQYLIVALIILRLKNPILYREYIAGNCLGSEVMNYIDELVLNRDSVGRFYNTLLAIESGLYYADQNPQAPLGQLTLLQSGKPLTHPEYLSKKTQRPDEKRVKDLIEQLRFRESHLRGMRDVIIHVSGLLELVEMPSQSEL